ncbi:MAG: replicative DNA helicase [Lachnospiraceae bacterium]|nr:replicative DNA helicase [Lachnospiraceae bacterium]
MEEATIKQIMPHSLEAEQAVIGSMLMDVEAIPAATEKLSGFDFYNKQYAAMFDAMVDLYNEGKTCDLVTVKARLEENNVPSEVISLEFIREIVASVPTSANIKHYAEIVYEKAVLRNLLRTNLDINNTIYAGNEKLDNILSDTEKRIFDILQKRDSGEIVGIRKVVLNVLEKMEKAAQTRGVITGLPTGFIDLDNQLSGLQPSDFILVAARPSVGKTAFILNITEHMALKKNIPVAIFSLEMSKEQLINRVMAQHSMVDSQKIRVGNLNDNEWGKIMETADVVANSEIIIDDTPGISIGELRSKCRKLKLEKDIQIVIIDYLQLMSGTGKESSREQEISVISRSLKGIARELNVPVIALSQLNRAVESRPDKKPIMADLRESGSIEQDADVIMLLSRKYNEEEKIEDRNTIVVNVAKQRNGPVGEIELLWIPQYTKFQSKAREQI